MKEQKPNWPLLAGLRFALAVVVTSLFHWSALFSPSHSDFHSPDARQIRTGYLRVPNPFVDGLRWWRGNWINVGTPYYRPISSYVEWCQVWLTLHWGWRAESLFDLFLFAAMAIACGYFVQSFTGSARAGFLGTALAGVAGAWCHGDPFNEWIAADNVTCLFFALLALGLFAQGKWAASIALMAVACLSKEWAFVLPVMFLAMAHFGRPENHKSGYQSGATAMGFVIALGIFRSHLRPYMLGSIPLPDETLVTVRSWWMISQTSVLYGACFLLDNATKIGLQIVGAVILAVAVFVFWKSRRESKILCVASLLIISYVPLHGLVLAGGRIYFPWMFVVVLTITAIHKLLEKVLHGVNGRRALDANIALVCR